MGLDTTHDCWHGSYSWFTWWRNYLAELGGYVPSEGYIPLAAINYDMYDEECFLGEWEVYKIYDPLLYLLVHSDCDGVIHPKEGRLLHARLVELLPLVNEEWEEKTNLFIDGLKEAYENNEDVEFH